MSIAKRAATTQGAVLETPSLRREQEFLAAARRSRSLHRHWAAPPRSAAQYRAFVKRAQDKQHVCHFVCTRDGELAGVINVNEIIRSVAQFGYLGYYAFAPHHTRGWMREGLALVLRDAFTRQRLHRLEANIQPDNKRSIALVHGLGFTLEGYSARYLKLAGRWRDHERWAITIEDWKAAQRHGRKRS
jgi:ribosomal-protein-alanine N-acetyltransferase